MWRGRSTLRHRLLHVLRDMLRLLFIIIHGSGTFVLSSASHEAFFRLCLRCSRSVKATIFCNGSLLVRVVLDRVSPVELSTLLLVRVVLDRFNSVELSTLLMSRAGFAGVLTCMFAYICSPEIGTGLKIPVKGYSKYKIDVIHIQDTRITIPQGNSASSKRLASLTVVSRPGYPTHSVTPGYAGPWSLYLRSGISPGHGRWRHGGGGGGVLGRRCGHGCSISGLGTHIQI